ncbi:unnamed protein product, partial [Pleuronectes platessa]
SITVDWRGGGAIEADIWDIWGQKKVSRALSTPSHASQRQLLPGRRIMVASALCVSGCTSMGSKERFNSPLPRNCMSVPVHGCTSAMLAPLDCLYKPTAASTQAGKLVMMMVFTGDCNRLRCFLRGLEDDRVMVLYHEPPLNLLTAGQSVAAAAESNV